MSYGIKGSKSILSILKHLHSCCLNPPIHQDFPKIKDLAKKREHK